MKLLDLLETAAALAQDLHRVRSRTRASAGDKSAVVALAEFVEGSGPGHILSHEELGMLVALVIRTAGSGSLEQYALARQVSHWADMLARDSANGNLAEVMAQLRASK